MGTRFFLLAIFLKILETKVGTGPYIPENSLLPHIYRHIFFLFFFKRLAINALEQEEDMESLLIEATGSPRVAAELSTSIQSGSFPTFDSLCNTADSAFRRLKVSCELAFWHSTLTRTRSFDNLGTMRG